MTARSHDAAWRARRNRARPASIAPDRASRPLRRTPCRPRSKRPFETAAALVAKLTRPEITVPVQCELVGRTAVRISLDPEVVRADEPRVLGGGGTAPTPSQYALAALGSCTAVTFAYWSEKLRIPIDLLRVQVQGDIDLRGFVGLADGVRPGFGRIRMMVTVSGPESAERYEELKRAVDRYSPVLDLVANPVPVQSTITVV